MIKSFFNCSFITLLCCNALNLFSQNQYVDLQTAVTNPNSKPGWTLAFADEFNGTKSSVWSNGFCWVSPTRNENPVAAYYTKDANYVSTSTSLKLVTKQEDYTLPGTGILKHYTSAMLDSDPCGDSPTPIANRTWIYGYFEMRCKNPKAQATYEAFWLFGPNYEIDAFEVGSGDCIVMTNHYDTGTPKQHYSRSKFIYSVPGQTFGNTWVTYAVKWEPNKIVWYINNVPVRTETSATSIIPNSPMRVIAQAGATRWSFDLNLLPVFPNEMEIDYIRVFQRANHSIPDPVFKINNSQSYVPTSPINIQFTSGLPIIFNGTESYMPNHSYHLSVQRCDINGNGIGTAASNYLTSTEVTNVDKLNLTAFAQTNGLTLSSGNYYKIKLSGESPLTYSTQYIYLTSCTSAISFKINGQNTTSWPSAIAVPQNYGKPKLIVDYSASYSCDNSYFISLQKCNASGVGTGTEIMKHMTATDKEHKSYFDVELFASQNSFTILNNEYYKVKIACGPVWTELTQVIHTDPCPTAVSFKINNQSNAFPSPIEISNGQDIYLDGTASGSPCNNQYSIIVRECTSTGTDIGPEYMDVNTYAIYDPTEQIYYYSIGKYNLREFFKKKGLVIGCNKYYKVKLAYTSPWSESTKIIHIQACSLLTNNFKINGVDALTYNFASPTATSLTIYSPSSQSISCDGSYFLSIRKRVNGVLTGPEIAKWLTWDEIYQIKETGVFDLKLFANDPNYDGNTSDGIPLTNNTTYIVNFAPGHGDCGPSWTPNYKTIYFGTGSGKEATSIQQEGNTEEMVVYPNPTNYQFAISLPNNAGSSTINLMNLQGQIVKSLHVNQELTILNVNELQSGFYILQAICGDNVFTKKVQVVKN